jgi:dienelactone hydrolase
METRDIEYHANGERFVGYLAVDDAMGGRRPGVLIGPEGTGLGPLAKDVARRLAALGYVAFAVDYHGGGRDYMADVSAPSDLGAVDMAGALARLQALMTPPAPLRGIAAAALEILTQQPQTDPVRLAAIGYCFGGTMALELARSGAPLQATVGFHCGLGTAEPAGPGAIHGAVLAQIGDGDPIVPADQRLAFEQEMASSGADWRMIVHGGAGHSFTNPTVGIMGRPGFAYHKVADERSWRALLEVFDEVFGRS